ncbi:EI24 domain-containing protein [bacterium]|nr:EI24 domain-containing protein [bacterium]
MNDESKSKEISENSDETQEESIFNRPRQKLSIAKERNQKPETPPPPKHEMAIKEEEKKPDNVEIVKEKVSKAVEVTKKKIDETLKGGTSLKTAAKAIFSNGKLTVASLTVVLAMVLITIFSYHQISSWVDSLTAPFFDKEPLTEGFFDYIYYFGWLITRMVFKAVAAIVVFYISFIFSYTVTSPLYSFISVLAEDIYFGKPEDATDFSLDIMIEDVLQALKIAGMALVCTVFAFFVNLVPVIGQITAIAFYIVINSLMLIDFPASRRSWDLKTKTLWIRENLMTTLRIGSLPTLISMIPLANNIILAFCFPLFVVHATMNFAEVEKNRTDKSIS